MLFEMCFIAESVQANRDMLGHYSHQGQAQTVAAVRRLPQRPVGASVTSHCKSGRHGTVDDWRPEWRIFPCGAPRVSEGPSHVHTGSWVFFPCFLCDQSHQGSTSLRCACVSSSRKAFWFPSWRRQIPGTESSLVLKYAVWGIFFLARTLHLRTTWALMSVYQVHEALGKPSHLNTFYSVLEK